MAAAVHAHGRMRFAFPAPRRRRSGASDEFHQPFRLPPRIQTRIRRRLQGREKRVRPPAATSPRERCLRAGLARRNAVLQSALRICFKIRGYLPSRLPKSNRCKVNFAPGSRRAEFPTPRARLAVVRWRQAKKLINQNIVLRRQVGLSCAGYNGCAPGPFHSSQKII